MGEIEHGELGETSSRKPGGPDQDGDKCQTVGCILKVEPTSFADGLIHRGHLHMYKREEARIPKVAGQSKKKGFASTVLGWLLFVTL